MRNLREFGSLLNNVSQRHQSPITEEYVHDMRPVQVIPKRSHNISSLHNVGFNPIDVRDVAWFTANISR